MEKQFLENASLAFKPTKAIQEFKEEINELQSQNDELAKALGKTTVERDWAVGKLKSSVSLNKRKELIEGELKLTKTRQCKLLHVSRASHYYKPVPMSQQNIKIMHSIDQIATDNSEYGYRFIHQQLLEDGYSIGKDKVLKYM